MFATATHVLILRRREGTAVIVGWGKTYRVLDDYSSLEVTVDLAGVTMEDEIYLTDNTASPYSIANLSLHAPVSSR